ncbi:hypothetical protein K488DRAFT_87786 [Vararia minispora EC-137]|uniref:Uncharacterized protein n=1 Tax=Vararia minispora EC-137 TaxID=1314806 RepID=A0ACB8QEZ5_9AGAM|nr:hypothetical protein K488DRAFT_87786 [Vararia minispora EC-137]
MNGEQREKAGGSSQQVQSRSLPKSRAPLGVASRFRVFPFLPSAFPPTPLHSSVRPSVRPSVRRLGRQRARSYAGAPTHTPTRTLAGPHPAQTCPRPASPVRPFVPPADAPTHTPTHPHAHTHALRPTPHANTPPTRLARPSAPRKRAPDPPRPSVRLSVCPTRLHTHTHAHTHAGGAPHKRAPNPPRLSVPPTSPPNLRTWSHAGSPAHVPTLPARPRTACPHGLTPTICGSPMPGACLSGIVANKPRFARRRYMAVGVV